MDVSWHLPLEELVRLERAEKDAARSKRLRIVILAIGGYTAPAIAMSVGLSRRICQRWVARVNAQGLEGLKDRRSQQLEPTLTPEGPLSPQSNTRIANLFLEPFSQSRGSDEHAAMIWDGAGFSSAGSSKCLPM